MATEHSDTKLLAIFLGASQCLFSLKDGANNKWIINSGASFEYETCMFGNCLWCADWCTATLFEEPYASESRLATPEEKS